ncbi:hypothetical protein QBC43DRAFT_264617 [Cladorrhinum sp. PSN259]|nr:hypothetical protein QBC43DRAFT_264617 [Cladorrhinum sp. PSN259]
MQKQIKEVVLNPLRIYILGLGNLGQYVAYSLKDHDQNLPLRMIVPNLKVLKEFQKNPKIQYLHYDGFTRAVSEDISSRPGIGKQRGKIASLILSTHPSQAKDAIKPFVHLLGRHSEVLFLHQGFGVIEEVMKMFPNGKRRPRFWTSLCRAQVSSSPDNDPFSIYLEKPGPLEIEYSKQSEMDNADNPENAEPPLPYLIQQLLATSSLDVKILPPKLMYLNHLEKLAIQAVLHGTAGLFGCTIGQLRATAERQRILKLITKEVCQVIFALAPKTGYSNIRERLLPKNLKSLINYEMGQQEKNYSLIQKWEPVRERNPELKRNYPTELNNGLSLEDVNGYIVRKGQELGIPMPNNIMMLELLRMGRTLNFKQADRHFYVKKDWDWGMLEPSKELPPRRWKGKQWSWA